MLVLVPSVSTAFASKGGCFDNVLLVLSYKKTYF